MGEIKIQFMALHLQQKETSIPKKESPVLLDDLPIIPKKYTVALKSSQLASDVTATTFDSGER